MRRTLASLLLTLAIAGCGATTEAPVEYEQPFTSAVATLLNFEFDGQLTSSSATNTKGLARAQLIYTVGSLNDHNGVARLERLAWTASGTTYLGGGLYRHKYHAKLPVAWGSKVNLPSAFSFTLPLRAEGASSFTAKYGQQCSDAPADVTVNN